MIMSGIHGQTSMILYNKLLSIIFVYYSWKTACTVHGSQIKVEYRCETCPETLSGCIDYPEHLNDNVEEGSKSQKTVSF